MTLLPLQNMAPAAAASMLYFLILDDRLSQSLSSDAYAYIAAFTVTLILIARHDLTPGTVLRSLQSMVFSLALSLVAGFVAYLMLMIHKTGTLQAAMIPAALWYPASILYSPLPGLLLAAYSLGALVLGRFARL